MSIKRRLIPAKPRNKELYFEKGKGGSGSNFVNVDGGSSGSEHTHDNLDILDEITEETLIGLNRELLDTNSTTEPSDENIMSSLRIINEIDNRVDSYSDEYISRVNDDVAEGHITFKSGITVTEIDVEDLNADNSELKHVKISEDIKSKDYIPGMIGKGFYIDKNGNAVFDSLEVRTSLTVPELRFNKVSVYTGIRWDTFGGGIIESVVIDKDSNGNNLNTGTITLQLEAGEFGAIDVDDLCQGIFHNFGGSNDTVTEDQKNGNIRYKGFNTTYFRITSIIGSDNRKFKYVLRNTSSNWSQQNHPQPYMHFASYANPSNTDRQTCSYTTTDYSISLTNMTSWEYNSNNIFYISGKLDGFEINGTSLEGVGTAQGNAYIWGTIQGVSHSPIIMEANYLGAGLIELDEDLNVSIKVSKGWDDITNQVTQWSVIRETSNSNTDNVWNNNHSNFNGTITISHKLVNSDIGDGNSALFTFGAKVENVWHYHSIVLRKVDIGGDTFSINLGSNYVAWKVNPSGYALNKTLNVPVYVYKNGSRVNVEANQMSASWVPYGLGITFQQNNVRFAATSNFNPISEGTTIDVNIDGKTYELIFTWDPLKDGASGNDGITTQIVYKINNSASTYPTMPSGSNLNTWTETRQTPTQSMQYEWTTQRKGNDSAGWSGWTVPVIVNRWVKDGEKGDTGEPGASSHLHIRYSQNANGDPMTTNSTGAKYVGIAVSNSSTAPTGYSSYSWSKILGDEGAPGSIGAEGKTTEFIFLKNNSSSTPSTPTGHNPAGGWTRDYPEPTSSLRYIWISQRTGNNSAWSVWSTPKLFTRWANDGLPGVPGQIPVQKEWVVNDTHRNTDDFIDFIYVRGSSNNTSYWYKLVNKGTTTAGNPPSNGNTPQGYERISWMESLAVKTLIVEEGNLANFIFKDNILMSIKGKMLDGTSINYGEYTEWQFVNSTSTPTSSSAWQALPPSGSSLWARTRLIRDGQSPTAWNQRSIPKAQFSNTRDGTYYSNYSENRYWIKETSVSTPDRITNVDGGYNFIPNIHLDGSTGKLRANDVDISGKINASGGRIGDLHIEPDGSITFRNSSDEERFSIRTTSIPSASSIYSGTNTNGSISVSSMSRNTRGTTIASQTLSIANDGTQLTVNTISINISGSGQADARGLASRLFAQVSIYRNGNYYMNLCGAEISFTELGGLIKYESGSSPKQVISLAAGTYTFRLEVESIGVVSAIQANSSLFTGSWVHVMNLKRTTIGTDGIYSWFANNQLHFNEHQGLTVGGQVTMPGILYTATLTRNSGVLYSWGVRGFTASYSWSGNNLTVTHNLGHTNYVMNIDVAGKDAYGLLKSRSANTAVAEFTSIDGGHYLTITFIGQNKPGV